MKRILLSAAALVLGAGLLSAQGMGPGMMGPGGMGDRGGRMGRGGFGLGLGAPEGAGFFTEEGGFQLGVTHTVESRKLNGTLNSRDRVVPALTVSGTDYELALPAQAWANTGAKHGDALEVEGLLMTWRDAAGKTTTTLRPVKITLAGRVIFDAGDLMARMRERMGQRQGRGEGPMQGPGQGPAQGQGPGWGRGR